MFTVEAETSGLKRKAKDFTKEFISKADKILQQAGQGSLQRIKSGIYWTNRTGKTAASFVLSRVKVGHWVLRSSNKVARYLESGTKAHTIRPKSKSVLRFQSGGGLVFAKKVNHPGTKPIGYVAKEEDLIEKEIVRKLS